MSVNILKFVKDDQGSVRVYKIADDSLLASLSPALNIIKDRSQKDFFIIQNEKGENPFVLNYKEIDKSMCEPEILATNFNEFLIELTDKFFYSAQGSSGEPPASKNSNYGIVRPTFVHSKDFITTNSKFIKFLKPNTGSSVTVYYGGYDNLGTPFFTPYYGGTDLNNDIEVDRPVKSLFYLDDMFFRFEIATRVLMFDINFVVNPDSNTFAVFNNNPLYIYSECEYKNDAVSDTLRWLSTDDEESTVIRAFLRWKNAPELEVFIPE